MHMHTSPNAPKLASNPNLCMQEATHLNEVLVLQTHGYASMARSPRRSRGGGSAPTTTSTSTAFAATAATATTLPSLASAFRLCGLLAIPAAIGSAASTATALWPS